MNVPYISSYMPHSTGMRWPGPSLHSLLSLSQPHRPSCYSANLAQLCNPRLGFGFTFASVWNNILSPDSHMADSSTSFRSLLKCHRLREAPLRTQQNKIALPVTFCPFIALSTLSPICTFAYHPSPLLESKLHECRDFISWTILPLPGT